MKAAGNAYPAVSGPAGCSKFSPASVPVKVKNQISNRLKSLCTQDPATSLCGLGQGAPNPVASTLRLFRDEYEAHIKEKRCPAKVCRALIRYEILDGVCTGCTVCARNCPVNAISGERRMTHVIDPDICIRCGICMQVCNFQCCCD